MRTQRLGFVLTAVGFVLSLLVGVIVYVQVSEAERVRTSLPTLRVVAAALDIPPRTEIAASMLDVHVIPDQLMQQGAATRVEDVAGKFTPEGFVKGEVINARKLGELATK